MTTCYNLDELLEYLVNEQSSGRLNKNTIEEYGNRVSDIMRQEEENKEFVESFRGLLNNASKLNDVEEKDDEEEILKDFIKYKNHKNLINKVTEYPA